MVRCSGKKVKTVGFKVRIPEETVKATGFISRFAASMVKHSGAKNIVCRGPGN